MQPCYSKLDLVTHANAILYVFLLNLACVCVCMHFHIYSGTCVCGYTCCLVLLFRDHPPWLYYNLSWACNLPNRHDWWLMSSKETPVLICIYLYGWLFFFFFTRVPETEVKHFFDCALF